MIVNKNTKHLHFLMYKTASGTIYKNCIDVGYQRFAMHTGITCQHLKEEVINNTNSWIISCCLRNPWDHAVSFYHHTIDRKRFFIENFYNIKNFKKLSNENKIIKANPTFENFIHNIYPLKYKQSLILNKFDPQRTIINQYINFNDISQMYNLFNKIGIPLDVKRVHRREDIDTIFSSGPKSNNYQEFYNDKTKKLIEHECKEEINKLDYKF